MPSILVPREVALFWSAPKFNTSEILVLISFANTIEWDRNQWDWPGLTLSMRRVTKVRESQISGIGTGQRLASGRDSWCWSKGTRPLGKRRWPSRIESGQLIYWASCDVLPRWVVAGIQRESTQGRSCSFRARTNRYSKMKDLVNRREKVLNERLAIASFFWYFLSHLVRRLRLNLG